MRQLALWCGIAVLAGCAVDDDATTATATAASFAYTPMGFARFAADGSVRVATTDGGAVSPIAFNSAGGAVTAGHGPPGAYVVTFNGLGATTLPPGQGGNVQVTAEGAGNVRCRVNSWGGSPNLIAQVQCNLPSGAGADSAFAFLFFRNATPSVNTLPTTAAYAWVDSAGTASATYNYNSKGLANTTSPSGGARIVHIPDATGINASMMVTAYGGADPGAACAVNGWTNTASGIDVTIDCRDVANAQVFSAFSFSYSQTGPASAQQGAHAWFNGSVASSAYSSALGKVTGCSTATITASGGAPVTLTVAGDLGSWGGPTPFLRASFANRYGPGGTCKVESLAVTGIAPSSSAATTVRCYDATGAVIANPLLTFTHVTSDASGPC